MADGSKWTIVVVDGDGSGGRQLWLSREMMRVTIALALIGFALSVSFLTQLVMHLSGPQATARLVRTNQELKSELSEMRGQVGYLNVELDSLSRRDEYFRLLAGLDPLDEGVRRAGIGGPDAELQQQSSILNVDYVIRQSLRETTSNVNELMRRANVLTASWQEAHDSLEWHHDRLSRKPSILPTQGYISSAFSRWRYHPILKYARRHAGIDVAARTGTPIVAAAKGRVKLAGRYGHYGNMVEIDHGFNTVTRYAHASKLLVRPGQVVNRGDKIALVGETGLAVGPHLHYEVLINGQPVNPRNFLMVTTAIPD